MADVLISYDENGYITIKAVYDRIGAKIQTIVDNYNLLGFGNLVAAELAGLFASPIDFIFDKMTGGQPVSIAGLEVDKTKAIEILVKPAGYEIVVSAIIEARKGIKDDEPYGGSNRSVNSGTIPGIYTIDNANHVILQSDFDTKLQEQNKLYAKTDRAKALLSFAQNIIDKANELGITSLLKSNPNGLGHTINHILTGAGTSMVDQTIPYGINGKELVKFNNPEWRHP